MQSIPTIDLLAAIHLFFVGGVLTCGLVEIIFEYYALFFDRTLHHSSIRIHYWVDILAEIPLFVGITVSGTLMLLFLESISLVHLLKIGVAYSIVIGFSMCALETFRRKRMLDQGAPEKDLVASTKTMMIRNAIIIGVLTWFVIFTGLWLSHHRLLEYV